MNRPTEVGPLIAYYRRQRGHTQKELAAAVGTTGNYLSWIETGRRRPSIDLVIRIARALGHEAQFEIIIRQERR